MTPLWLSLDAQLALRKLEEAGKVMEGIASHVVGYDDANCRHALVWIKKSASEVVFAKTAARAQSFPADLSDLVIQIATIKLHETVKRVLAGTLQGTSIEEFEAVLKKHKLLRLGSCFARGAVVLD